MEQQTDKKAIMALGTGHFMIDLYASALIPLYPFLTVKLGITLSTISLILTIGHLTSSMMQPVFGFIADSLKHRTFMITGLILGAIFIPLVVSTNNVYIATLCLMIGMCGNALFHPQVTGLVNIFNYDSPNLTKYMGRFMGLGAIGYALGPLLSSTLVDNFGTYSLCYITVLGILTAVILYFKVPKIPACAINIRKESFFKIMQTILKSKTHLSLILISSMKSAVSLSFATYMPFVLKNHGFSLKAIGLIVALFLTLNGISMLTSARLEEKIGAVKLIRWSFWAILPMTLAFFYLVDKMPILAASIFIIMGYFIALSVSVTLVAAQKTMSEYRGVISGVMQGFSWSLGALAIYPLGLIGEHFGISIGLVIVAALAFLTGWFGLTKDLQEIFETC